MAGQDGMVGLSSALDALRDELEQAWAASLGRRVRFRVSEVTMTVQAVTRTETKGGGRLRWYLIEAGGDRTAGRETTQTLVLTLTPSVYDDTGQPGPLDVAGDQPEPGH